MGVNISESRSKEKKDRSPDAPGGRWWAGAPRAKLAKPAGEKSDLSQAVPPGRLIRNFGTNGNYNFKLPEHHSLSARVRVPTHTHTSQEVLNLIVARISFRQGDQLNRLDDNLSSPLTSI